MATKRQPRGPKLILNEQELEKRQLEAGTSTPIWLSRSANVHPMTAIKNKAQTKVAAKEERNDRAAKRSSKENKENAKGTKRKATKSAPPSDEPQHEPSPPTKRIYMPRPENSAPRDEEPATASGRSAQHAEPAPAEPAEPACMTEQEFDSWLAMQPGQTVPADQHRTLLVRVLMACAPHV